MKNATLFELLAAAEYFTSAAIIVEQVPEAMSRDSGAYQIELQAGLLSLGYQVRPLREAPPDCLLIVPSPDMSVTHFHELLRLPSILCVYVARVCNECSRPPSMRCA